MGQFDIAIDFDGTIVEHAFPALGRPVPGAFVWMKQWQEAGATLMLWTMRGDASTLPQAVELCRANGVEFAHVNARPDQKWTASPKLLADCYVDDRSVGCPLIIFAHLDGPVVDWETVGPLVLKLIQKSRRG